MEIRYILSQKNTPNEKLSTLSRRWKRISLSGFSPSGEGGRSGRAYEMRFEMLCSSMS